MQPKQLQTIKERIKSQIERGDFVTLGRVLEIPRQSALMRYARNNENSILCMRDIIAEKEKIVEKLRKKYNGGFGKSPQENP